MIHIKTTSKSLADVAKALETVVPEHKFGLLHVHDLKKTMEDKGVEFARECLVFEVCNPHHAKAVLDEDIRVNLALPCRIGVWEEGGETKVGTLLPTQLMGVFGDGPAMDETAAEVEKTMLAIIEDVL
ncbi:MAG: DUF302 domain-containing protein [Candidatus Krumholzibacteriota bacterium]